MGSQRNRVRRKGHSLNQKRATILNDGTQIKSYSKAKQELTHATGEVMMYQAIIKEGINEKQHLQSQIWNQNKKIKRITNLAECYITKGMHGSQSPAQNSCKGYANWLLHC